MKKNSFYTLILALLFTTGSQTSAGSPSPERPNIVIILADDLGSADLSTYGAPRIKTPELDRLANQGMKFTQFYAENFCSPSRAALLTGSYAHRVGIRKVFWPDSTDGLNPDEITIAELLKGKGYTTAVIGKWHLGHRKPFLPTNQGFDYYFGLPFSNDMGPNARPAKGPYGPMPIMRNEEVIERGPDQTQLTRRYTEETVRFIKGNRDKPFFVYLAHTMPHVPLYASDDFLGKSNFGLYGDVVEEIDWSTGRILETLDELGLADDTLVVFLSDNGPWLQKGAHGGLATPLREGKGTTWEGGHRVPAIMRWPGKIPANVTNDAMTTIMDLYPTIAGLVGADLPEDRVIDGKNIWPLLTGQTENSPHEAYYYYRLGRFEAVRIGEWKLHLEGNRRDYNNVHFDYTDDFLFHQREQLFNLADDIGEQRNLVLDYPDIVKKLREAVAEHKKDIKANSRPLGVVD
ncbi:MAG: arylsulfatase [Verrucomicrobia bacterium]|nr:MAG: arylsulfatase [Verrucomicrobiota bacterium]